MSLYKSTLIYGVSNALIPASAFLLLIVLTNFLTPAEYGIVTMFVILMGMGQACIGINVHGAIGRRYYDRDKIEFPEYVTNGLGIILATGLLFIIASFVLGPFLSRWTNLSSPWLALTFLMCSCQMVCWTMSALWVSMAKPIPYTLFQVYISGVTLVGVLLLVVYGGMTWEGRILGQGFALCSAGCIALIALYRKGLITFTFRKDYLRHALAFGLPLIPHSVGIWIITATDHWLIKTFFGMDELGIYGVGIRIGMLIMLAQDAFNRAWMPQFYERLKSGSDEDHKYVIKVTYGFNVCILAVALLFGLVAPYIFSLFLGEAYLESSQYVLWIALGYAFNGMYKLVANIFYYLHKTGILAIVTVITAILNVVISYFLIKALGSIGAAIGTMTAFLLMYIFTHILAVRHYKLPWNPLRKAH